MPELVFGCHPALPMKLESGARTLHKKCQNQQQPCYKWLQLSLLAISHVTCVPELEAKLSEIATTLTHGILPANQLYSKVTQKLITKMSNLTFDYLKKLIV